MPDSTIITEPGYMEKGEESAPEAFPFGPVKPVYVNFALKSFQTQIAYRFEYFIGVVNGLLFIFIFTSLWNAIYKNPQAAEDTPFDKDKMIAYAVFAMIIRISMTMEELGVGRRVRSGDISLDLIKPVSYSLMLFSEAFGQTVFHWVSRAAPILVFSLWAFDVAMPDKASNYALLAVSWAMGYVILFFVNFAFALLAFWFLETFSFQLMKFGLFTVFSGGIVPIDFFPDWIRPMISLLPFQYILYVPTSVFIGHAEGARAAELVGPQAAWVVILGGLCQIMWRAAGRKLVLQGG